MIVPLAKDHDELAMDVFDSLEAVVAFTFAKAVTVDVGCEVTDGGADAFVEGTAEGEVATEAHALSTLSTRGFCRLK